MVRIVLLGAGSTVFAKNIIGDILSYPELAGAQIVLHDIDAARLEESMVVARKIIELLKAQCEVSATLDRREALRGADYAIGMFQVGGFRPATVIDFEIPKKYGLQQTIGDTLGIGGIMRALRTAPVLASMLTDMEELCPDVTFINYANPMAMNMWTCARLSSIRAVGLCHSVPHTAEELCRDLGIPVADVDYLVAGINHLAFFLTFQHTSGRDLYPELRRLESQGGVPSDNRVRYDLLKHFGYFVTESSEHLSEYVPWYIKRDRSDLIEQFNIPIDEYLGRCEIQQRVWSEVQKALHDPSQYNEERVRQSVADIKIMPRMREGALSVFRGFNEVRRSCEFGSQIIFAMETGLPQRIYGNVINHGVISNLPDDCCVEVPCLVDASGIHPCYVGSLPIQLAALMQTNINVQGLSVGAAILESRDHVYHAALLDPHTAAELSTREIHAMVDELLEAHREYLPPGLFS